METLSIQSQVTGTLQHIQQTQTPPSTQYQQQFQPAPGYSIKQYNSPIGLYSQENVQEAMMMQATGRAPGQTVHPPAGEHNQVDHNPTMLSPTKQSSGVSHVLTAALAESKPINHHHHHAPADDKMPLYETNAIGGRRKIAQTASFNKLMMDVLGE